MQSRKLLNLTRIGRKLQLLQGCNLISLCFMAEGGAQPLGARDPARCDEKSRRRKKKLLSYFLPPDDRDPEFTDGPFLPTAEFVDVGDRPELSGVPDPSSIGPQLIVRSNSPSDDLIRGLLLPKVTGSGTQPFNSTGKTFSAPADHSNELKGFVAKIEGRNLPSLAGKVQELAERCASDGGLLKSLLSRLPGLLTIPKVKKLEKELRKLIEEFDEKFVPKELRGSSTVSDSEFGDAAGKLMEAINLGRLPVDCSISRSVVHCPSAVLSSVKNAPLEDLGTGSFGSAYLLAVPDSGAWKRMVKKEFELHLQFDAREIRNTCRLPLDKLLVPHTFGYSDGRIFVCSEFGGKTLKKWIEEEFPLTAQMPCTTVAFMMFDLLKQLVHLHGEGVVHKDMKPENVVVREENGRPVFHLIDFGSCLKIIDLLCYEDLRKGATLHYMSPRVAQIMLDGKSAFERAHDASDTGPQLSPSYDLRCLGLLVYFCQNRGHPYHRYFDGEDESIFKAIIEHPEDPLRELEEGLKSGKSDYVDIFGMLSSMLSGDASEIESPEKYLEELEKLYGEGLATLYENCLGHGD